MSWWNVECVGSVREVYCVEAATEQEALKKWLDGGLVISESEGVEPVSATCVEETE